MHGWDILCGISKGTFPHKISYVPQPFKILFKKKNECHSYGMSSAHHSHIPAAKLNLNKTGIKYRMVIVWNAIANQESTLLDVSAAVFEKSVFKLINTDGL